MNSDEEFNILFESIVAPKLLLLEFEKIILPEGWISPEYLFEKDGVWFGCSWDWRDHYLEIDLGHLFYFEDVMPRVIVQNTFESYLKLLGIPLREPALDSYHHDYLTHKFGLVVEFIDRVLEDLDRLYDMAQKERAADLSKTKKSRKIRRDFLMHLGRELKRGDLQLANKTT